MDTARIAHPAPPLTTYLNARALRGLRLFEHYGEELEQLSEDVFLVPSQDGKRMYRVQYGEHEYCSCPDHTYRDVSCVHIYAVGIAIAKGCFTHPEVLAGDPFPYAATVAAALAASECEECGVSVAGSDEGIETDGTVLCHGCTAPYGPIATY